MQTHNTYLNLPSTRVQTVLSMGRFLSNFAAEEARPIRSVHTCTPNVRFQDNLHCVHCQMPVDNGVEEITTALLRPSVLG